MNPTWLYVGILYAAAVAVARRAGIDLPGRIALLFFALVLVFFFKPMTQRYVNIPVDALTLVPPWSAAEGPRFLNAAMNDVTFQHAPWAHQAREALKSGRAPLWNEAAGAGYPLLANGQSSALSPIRLLALPLSLGHAMTAEAAIKILIALTFTFLYCRGRKWSELASAIGAVSFGFGGFLTIWLHFPHATTACFLPAVLYLIDRIAVRPTYGAFVAAALVWAAIVYGGHPETASHIFVLALLYVLWIVFVERSAGWRLLLVLGGAMTIAALLAAPFLIPFAEAVTKSQRFELLRLKPWSVESLPFKEWQSALVQMQPHFWGRVPSETTWGPSDPDPISGFAGILGIAAWLTLLLTVIRNRAWRSRDAFFVLSTIFVFGVMMGWPILSEGVHRLLPLVAHHRFRVLLNMLLALQAACVVSRVESGERRELSIAMVVTAVLLVLPLALVKFPAPGRFAGAATAALPSFAVLLLASVLTASSGRLRRLASAAALLLLVAVVAELFSITRGWSPAVREELMYPRTPMLRALETLTKGEREPFRVAGWGATFFPNTAPMYGVQDIRVHDPMANAKYMNFLHLAAGYETAPYFAQFKNIETPLLDYLNVHYMLVDDRSVQADPGHFRLVYDGQDGRIFRNLRALPRFYPVRNVVLEFRDEIFFPSLTAHRDFASTALLDRLEVEDPRMRDDFFRPRPANAPEARSSIASHRPADYRVEVQAPRWSLMVSSIPWWPGWKVERNGRRVEPIRVNGLFLGFAVPPGHSSVRVWYSPWTFWLGIWAAGLTALTLVLIPLWRRSGARAAVTGTFD